MSTAERVPVFVSRSELLDRYVDFVAGRCRPNAVIVTKSDLGVFFSVVDKHPVDVTAEDVLAFVSAQRIRTPRTLTEK